MGEDLFPSASVSDPFIGRTLDGRYEVLARLGAGGVGVVYKGRDAQLNRLVAIKVLPESAAASPEWRRQFEREARAVSALAHPNVVPVTAFGIDGGVPYLVTELLDGKTLADLISEGPVAPARALDIVRQTLRGLAVAHNQAIAHLDLKPANIFLQALPDQADRVRLVDFGVAKLVEGASSSSMTYMSPEQAKAERVDTRADIYATGAILFQLLAGRPPYVADTPEGVMKAHVSEPVPSLAKVRPELSIAGLVQPVIDRAMAKKPADRYPKALWMLQALEAIDGGSPVVATSAEVAPTVRDVPAVHAPHARGSRARITAIALVVIAASAVAGVTFVRRHRDSLVERAPEPRPPAPAPAQPPPPTTAAATQTQTQTQTKPAIAVTPGHQARDPWQEAVPEALQPIRDRLERGAPLNEGSLGPAYAFARQHPGDPRPWLLIAHAYAQLNWLSDSVERYQRAYRADPSSRGDPQMLEDLLKAATHRVAGRNAAQAIRDIYGAEALPALDKAIARAAGNDDASERLDHLRDSLEQ